jgi:hypothetical protein
MNGEPRASAWTTADIATSANNTPATSVRAEQPLLEAASTDGVTQTTMKEDAKLAPLFTQDVAMGFRSRWDLVQRSFVDSPREAVHAADELVAQVTKSLADTFANLEAGLDRREAATTENLRIALRQYRSFFERLLSI